MNKHLLKCLALPLALASFCCPSLAETQQNGKFWSGIFLTGPLTGSQVLQYYLDTQLRLVSRSDTFDQAVANAALGYQYSSKFSFWLGGSWVSTNDPIEDVAHEYRLWQQISSQGFSTKAFDIATRTRLEERRDTDEPQWALRLRQKITLTKPLKSFKNKSLVAAEEIFFNLTNPEWITNKVVDQNRISLGIAIPLSKQTILEWGYLNQLLFRNPNEMYHGLYINLRINTLTK